MDSAGSNPQNPEPQTQPNETASSDANAAAAAPKDSPPASPNQAGATSETPAPPPGYVADGGEIVRPASDHFKIAFAPPPKNLKGPSIFTPKGVASWYQINRRAVTASLIASVVALAIGGGLTYAALRFTKKPAPVAGFNPQGLDKSDLEKLSTDQLSLSKPGQTLTILADSKFKNGLAVGGNTDLHTVTIDGNSALQGGATIQNFLNVGGALNVTGGVNVGGNSSFNGVLSANTLTAKSLVASGGLTLGGHILTGGTTPTAQTGPAATGGSVTVVGNDTSGTVTITTGSAPFAGQLATVNFRSTYASTPKAILTAVGPSSGKLQIYATRTSTFFTIESSTKPEAGTTYIFDYFIAQ